MANRNTKTEKWTDDWFCDLKPNEKLMFLFLVENCDIAGFFELNVKLMSYMIGFNREEVETALAGINKSYVKSQDGKCIWVKNFIRHQNNFPLNPKNKAHEGIMTRMVNQLPNFNFNQELLQILPKTLSAGIVGEMTGTYKMNPEEIKGLGWGLGRAIQGLQRGFEGATQKEGAKKVLSSPTGNSNSSSNSNLNTDNNNLTTSDNIAEIDLKKNQISADDVKNELENEKNLEKKYEEVPLEVVVEVVNENGHEKSGKNSAKKKKKEKEKAESLHAKLKKSWCDFYKIKKGMEYYWQPKDAVNLNQITAKIKFHLKPAFESNGMDEEIPDEVLDNAFKAVLLSINDKFLMDNLEVAMLNSKLQPLLAKLKDRFGENSSRDSAIDQFVNG